MKKSYVSPILIALFAGLFWACAPAPVVTDFPSGPETGGGLFERAEKLFAAKAYAPALEAYHDYLLRFPDTSLAPAAVMKIGAIHAALGNHAEAREVYRRVLATYPESPFARDAAIERLASFYQEGRYRDLIREAKMIPEDRLDRIHLLRRDALIGDAHMALGAFEDALVHYASALRRGEGIERHGLAGKIVQSVARMSSDEISKLLGDPPDDIAAGYLMYRLAQNRAAEGEDEDAIRILTDFIRKYPDHENAAPARDLLGELGEGIKSLRLLGCLLPLTGSFQAYGNRALKGVELALSRYTGEKGRSPVRIVIRDTGSDPEKTAAAMGQLAEEKVLAVIGPLSAAEHAARTAQENGIPIVTLTHKDDICDTGDYVFRNFLTPKMQIEALVAHAVKTRGLNRFAVFYPDEPYGRTFMNLFREEVAAQGGEVVGIEAYRLAQTDFKDSIRKLARDAGRSPASKPVPQIGTDGEELPGDAERKGEIAPTVEFEALFIPDGPKKAGLIIPQLAFHDVRNVLLLGTNLWHSESLIEMARQHAQGAILTDGFFPYGRSEEVARFVRDYRETYGEMPGFIEAVAYDTALILLERMHLPEVRSAGEMKNALSELRDFRGVTGSTSFDGKGEARKSVYLLQIKGNKFIEVDPK